MSVENLNNTVSNDLEVALEGPILSTSGVLLPESCNLGTPVAVKGKVDMPTVAVILDWDDTLLPTTYLKKSNVDPEVTKKMEDSIINVFKVAAQLGPVFIVTAADSGWVQYSAALYVPRVLEALKKITVLSAKDEYTEWLTRGGEKKIINNRWWIDAKKYAMRTVVHYCFPDVQCLLSVGDSLVEREAVIELCSEMNLKVKSVKISERSTVKQLMAQHDLLTRCFVAIVATTDKVDVQMSISMTSETSDTTKTTEVSKHQHPTDSFIESIPLNPVGLTLPQHQVLLEA
jgi:hypothetical protein